MNKVTAFDNFDDMMAHINEERNAADGRVEDWQAALKEDDCFIRYEPSINAVIYGVVEAIYKEDEKLYAEPHMKHFRPTRCFSFMCPEGEYGDVHVSSVSVIISKEVFEKAKQCGWPSDLDFVRKLVDFQ